MVYGGTFLIIKAVTTNFARFSSSLSRRRCSIIFFISSSCILSATQYSFNTITYNDTATKYSQYTITCNNIAT